MKNLLLSLLISLSVLATVYALAGESPYNPGGGTPPAQQTPKPAPQDYSYYCWARTLDAKTEYRTDILSEPTPHNGMFIGQATQAWADHLAQTVGRNKTVGQCYEGPTASAKPAWEKGFEQPGTKQPVHVDWHHS